MRKGKKWLFRRARRRVRIVDDDGQADVIDGQYWHLWESE